MDKFEAMRLGLVRFQGKPCIYDHSGERYSSTGGCVECLLGTTADRAKRRARRSEQSDQRAAYAEKRREEISVASKERFAQRLESAQERRRVKALAKSLAGANRREKQILKALKGTNVWRGMALPAGGVLSDQDRQKLDVYAANSPNVLHILLTLAELTCGDLPASLDWEAAVGAVLGLCIGDWQRARKDVFGPTT